MKFKNGDRVKIINRHSNFYGATGTVVGAYCANDCGVVCVRIYIAPGIKHDVTFGASDLMQSNVVYEPKCKGETKMKFKTGDMVKVIDHNCALCGSIGTVVEVIGSSIYLRFSYYKYDNDGYIAKWGPYSASDLKLISDNYMVKRGNGMLINESLSGADQDGDTMFKIPLNSVYGIMGDYGRGGFTQMFNKDNIPEIRNVYFNDPLTCVIWKDGTKTFVKNADGDHNYDPEKALAMAISKKALGNKYNYYKEFEKWLPEEDAKFAIKSLLEASSELRKSFSSFKIISKEYINKRMALTKNPVEKAYLALLKVNDDPTSKDTDFAAAIEEAIAYLGEALDN